MKRLKLTQDTILVDSGSTNTGGTVVPERQGYPTKARRLESTSWGFLKESKGYMISSKPATLHEAINMALAWIESNQYQGKALLELCESNKKEKEDNPKEHQ
ncbi:hypothetical protein Tco_1211488 [Tanacetum coccineum]